jgi:hypothetical protein
MTKPTGPRGRGHGAAVPRTSTSVSGETCPTGRSTGSASPGDRRPAGDRLTTSRRRAWPAYATRRANHERPTRWRHPPPRAAPAGTPRSVIGQASAAAGVPARAGRGRANPHRTGRRRDPLDASDEPDRGSVPSACRHAASPGHPPDGAGGGVRDQAPRLEAGEGWTRSSSAARWAAPRFPSRPRRGTGSPSACVPEVYYIRTDGGRRVWRQTLRTGLASCLRDQSRNRDLPGEETRKDDNREPSN